jgi:hypothetical protein
MDFKKQPKLNEHSIFGIPDEDQKMKMSLISRMQQFLKSVFKRSK